MARNRESFRQIQAISLGWAAHAVVDKRCSRRLRPGIWKATKLSLLDRLGQEQVWKCCDLIGKLHLHVDLDHLTKECEPG